MIHACYFLLKFGSFRDDQVVVMFVFILLLTFHFLLMLLFDLLFHRIVPHPELVDMRTMSAPNYALLCYLRRRMTFGTLRSVPVGTAGKSFVDYLCLSIPACYSFRCFDQCAGDFIHVLCIVSHLSFLCLYPFFMAFFHIPISSCIPRLLHTLYPIASPYQMALFHIPISCRRNR